MVKFAIGTHNKWVPIVLSRSAGKESRAAPKSKSGALANSDKRSTGCKHGSCCSVKESNAPAADLIKTEKLHSGGSAGKNTDKKRDCIDDAKQVNPPSLAITADKQEFNARVFSTENAVKTITADVPRKFYLQEGISESITEGRQHVDALMQTETAAMGGLIDIEQENLNEIIEVFAPEAVERIAGYENEALALQSRNLKNFVRAMAAFPWVVNTASTIANSVVFLRWRGKGMASDGKASSPDNANLRDEEKAAALIPVLVSSPSVDMAPALPPPDVMLLPSPPSPLQIPTSSTQSEIEEVVEDAAALRPETYNKQGRKCKVKGLLKMHSAPSTPRDTRRRKRPFTVAVTQPSVLGGEQARASITEEHVEGEIQPSRTTSAPDLPVNNVYKKVAHSETLYKEIARRKGHALAAAGLLVTLSGLARGYVLAIMGIVCWWYALPALRKAVGDKPMVKSHHRNHVKTNKFRAAKARAKGEQIPLDGNGKQKMVEVRPSNFNKATREGHRRRRGNS